METQDTKQTERQTAIHTVLFMINSLLGAGHVLGTENKKLLAIDHQLTKAIEISKKAGFTQAEKEEQIDRVNAMRAVYAHVHWGNFICCQNVGPYSHFMISLMEECGCAECLKSKEEFLIDHADVMGLRPKFTGPRSGWQNEQTCPCESCTAARARGETPQHFAA